jgi:hypothetical protein
MHILYLATLPLVYVFVVVDLLFTTATIFPAFLEKRHYSQDQLNDDHSFKRMTKTQWVAASAFNLIQLIRGLSITNPLVVALLFSIVTIYLVVIDYRSIIVGSYFNNKVLPILLELSINGVIVSGAIAYFENKAENKNKEAARLNGRKLLGRYIIIISKHINKKDLRYLYTSPEYPFYLLKEFSFRSSMLDADKQLQLKADIANYSKNIKESSIALAAILSQLGPEYVWLSLQLVRTIKTLSNKKVDDSTYSHAVIDLLGSIVEIDELNYSGWKSKKSIQQLMNLKADQIARNPMYQEAL